MCAQNTHHNTKGNCVLFQAAPRQCSTNRDRVACSPRGCITVDHSRLDKCVRYALESVGVCVCACVKAVLEHGVNARTSQVESRRIKHRRRAHTHTHTQRFVPLCCVVPGGKSSMTVFGIDHREMCNPLYGVCVWTVPECVVFSLCVCVCCSCFQSECGM